MWILSALIRFEMKDQPGYRVIHLLFCPTRCEVWNPRLSAPKLTSDAQVLQMRSTTECGYLDGEGPEGLGHLRQIYLYHSRDARGRGVWILHLPLWSRCRQHLCVPFSATRVVHVLSSHPRCIESAAQWKCVLPCRADVVVVNPATGRDSREVSAAIAERLWADVQSAAHAESQDRSATEVAVSYVPSQGAAAKAVTEALALFRWASRQGSVWPAPPAALIWVQ